ncbi:hypothetical protein BDZ94DRAFT_1176031 [Collybia nuda]|uniref:Aldos-2-ulose dehydratase/isomerase (AUDH) Cupin domain-containing protein n=1 Tax=Collybia nuda TaxID=64659 RepID=A0A9P5XUT7_9AGAR|nr:hypothetical protein BDZ94DRAFT_1176031 [Collybia nuda]
MCCNGYSKSATANNDGSVHVDEHVVATPLPDGYWLNAFPFSKDSKLPDLIGYGAGFEGKPSAIKLFQNPKNVQYVKCSSNSWKLNEIQILDFPVAMTYADLTGDGYNDLIICDRYGPDLTNLWDAESNNGGRIQWLKNPGDRSAQRYWEAHTIGNSNGMHSSYFFLPNIYSSAGHFTVRNHIQVMGFPIIRSPNDFTSPVSILIYTPTYGADTHKGPMSWSGQVAFKDKFHLIQEVKVLPGANHGLDMLLMAGREGTVLIWFDEGKKVWAHNIIGTGLFLQEANTYWGSSSVDVVRVHDDDVGYIATCEAFKGNTVSVYVKGKDAPKGAASLKDSSYWTRIEVDDFGPLCPEQPTGTVQNVAAIKVGESDVYSFVVACKGAPENQGVFMYTPLDLEKGRFTKTRITSESAGRIAVAGYTDPTRMDIASISHYVPGFHTGPDPPSIRINTVCIGHSTTAISALRLNNEVLIRVPRPGAVPGGHIPTLPMISIAGRKLSLVVLPPGAKMELAQNDGAKVIYGQIGMIDGHGKTIVRTIATKAKGVATTHVVSHDGHVTAGKDGAVFLRVEELGGESQGPFATMDEVTTTNLFPRSLYVGWDVRRMKFPFLKVETLDWASNGLWNDFEFYNMTGFYVYFNDDALEEIVHIQAWTLGLGETVHNHSDKSFCEIHYCLTNGGGEGGMRYFEDDCTDPIDPALELTREYVENNSTLLVVPSMHEHGPLWKVQPGSEARPQLRPNDTADYPWHAWLAGAFGEFEIPIKPPLGEERQRFDVWMA